MLARAAFPAFFLTLAGFILFLLVTLSVPIIKSIYLLQIKYANDATASNVGVLGTCYRGGRSSIIGIDTDIADCTHPAVGYTLDTRLFGLDLGSDATKVLVKGISGALILNAVAAGAAGVSLFFAFFAWLCSSRILEIITFLTLFLSSLCGWIAFWLDLALVLVGRNRISDYSNGVVTGHIGNAIWIALVGAVCLSSAICLAGCGVFGRYSDRNYTSRNIAPAAGYTEKPAGRRFWQRGPAYRGTY